MLKMALSAEGVFVDGDYRCGYCCQLKNDLDDPRILPCKHVFCHSCLSSDYRLGFALECSICRVKHTDLIIGNLPKYPKEKGEPCYVCSHVAEMCCNQCRIYVCTEHAMQHDEAFASTMEITTAFGYKHEKAAALSARHKFSQKKDNVFCAQHNDEKIKRFCSTCYKALCMECALTDKCSKGINHIGEKIQSVSEKLKKKLIQILSELYAKSVVLSDLEKEANVILADQENSFREMKALVDKVTDEQVKEIQEKASKIKSNIDDTFKVSTSMVSKYCTELLARKNASDDLRREIHHLINLKSDFDVIKEYKKTCETSEEIIKILPSELSLPVIYLKPLAKHREAELEISPVCFKMVIETHHNLTSGNQGKEFIEPKALAHVLSSSPKSVCSVDWLDKKSLALGLGHKIEITDEKTKVIESHSVQGSVWNVCQYGTDYLVLMYGNGFKVELFSSDFSYKRNFTNGLGHFYCRMAVKDKDVLLTDNTRKCVTLFKDNGVRVMDIYYQTYITQPWGIQFQDDKSFIIADNSGGKVLKFYLEANSRPVWTYQGLVAPTGISIDSSGFIYVVSLNEKSIYLLTPSGTLLKKFSPPELFDNTRSISISGNYLACGSSTGVQLFKIEN